MGFTGKKAIAFKEKYISIFNSMETFINSRLKAKLENRELTDALKQNRIQQGKEDKFYIYSNENNLINKIVLGMTAKKFRELNNIEENELIRDYLSDVELRAIEKLQKLDTSLIELFSFE